MAPKKVILLGNKLLIVKLRNLKSIGYYSYIDGNTSMATYRVQTVLLNGKVYSLTTTNFDDVTYNVNYVQFKDFMLVMSYEDLKSNEHVITEGKLILSKAKLMF